MRIADRLVARFSPKSALRHALRLTEKGDRKGAFPFFARAARAKIAEAEYRIGRCYLEGAGVPPSRGDGVRWVERAAKQGYVEAQALLATLCLHGLAAGFADSASNASPGLFGSNTTAEPDFAAAEVWARKAAEGGSSA